MIVAFAKGIVFPMMVNVSTWFDEWPVLTTGSGGIIPEVIPDGVIWVDVNNVLSVDPNGTFLLREPTA